MIVISDTCAILMLIRINPEMFKDEKYGCVMLRESYDEYVRSKKFKDKYVWRETYRTCLRSVSESTLTDNGTNAALEQINKVVKVRWNEARNSSYDSLLSYVDKRIAAATVGFEGALCTGDGPLKDFVVKELECQVVSPLEVLNDWIEQGLLAWDDEKMKVLEDWVKFERPQFEGQIVRFQRLTGCVYPD